MTRREKISAAIQLGLLGFIVLCGLVALVERAMAARRTHEALDRLRPIEIPTLARPDGSK